MRRIGFVGLGDMGKPMAMNLIRGGFHVTVHDLRADVVQQCVAMGGHAAQDLKSLMTACDIVHIAVLNDQQLNTVVDEPLGLLSGASPGKIIIVHSTVNPQTIKRLAAAAKSRGVAMVDAPMSGYRKGAINGTLTFMIGCDDDHVLEQVRPNLLCMGKRLFHVGPVGAGQAVKLANNLMVLCNNLIAIEAVKLATNYGVSEETLMDVAKESSGNSYVVENWDIIGSTLQTHTLAGTDGVYQFMTKDIELAVQAAQDVGITLAIGAFCAQVSPEMLKTRDKHNRATGRIYTQ